MPMRLRPSTAALAVAVTALLGGCTGPAEAPPAAAPDAPPAAALTSPAAPTSAPPASADRTSTAPTSAAPTSGVPGVEPVSCGEVGPSGGAQVTLIADSTPAGRVGCTEAINVITEYYRVARTQDGGTGHFHTVQGWRCAADTGASGSGAIGCEKDGLTFHTEP